MSVAGVVADLPSSSAGSTRPSTGATSLATSLLPGVESDVPRGSRGTLERHRLDRWNRRADGVQAAGWRRPAMKRQGLARWEGRSNVVCITGSRGELLALPRSQWMKDKELLLLLLMRNVEEGIRPEDRMACRFPFRGSSRRWVKTVSGLRRCRPRKVRPGPRAQRQIPRSAPAVCAVCRSGPISVS